MQQTLPLPKSNIEQTLPSWLQAFHTLQNNALQSQKHFQEYMAKSHADFLALSQEAMKHLEHIAFNSSTLNADHSICVEMSDEPQLPQIPLLNKQPAENLQQQTMVRKEEKPQEIQEHRAQSGELSQLLLATVSDKTGYPLEMLALDTDLESDLGIDSIKRIEILASLEDKVPFLKGVDPAELTHFNTLREILAFISKKKIA